MAINQLHALVVAAPEELREQFRGLSPIKRVRKASAMRPGSNAKTVTTAMKIAMRTLAAATSHWPTRSLPSTTSWTASSARRHHNYRAARHRHPVGCTTARHRRRQPRAPALRELVRAPVRRAPLPASSGKTQRHRLNRGGDRNANCALHMIAVNRLSRCPRTRAYVKKRCPDGKADLDTLRRLKRYIAREIYELLLTTFEQDAGLPSVA